LVERNQEPNSHNSDRDENVCKVITKFDSPRKPPAPSDLHQDMEDSQESKKYSEVFGIPLKKPRKTLLSPHPSTLCEAEAIHSKRMRFIAVFK
jgi:hypothetical protein